MKILKYCILHETVHLAFITAAMEHNTCHSVDCNELEEQLQQLSLIAQQHPPGSNKRQQALTDLVSIVMNSNRLWYPINNFNQEIFEEAVQNLWLYVCDDIEKYNPSRGGVINWLNMLLAKRFYTEALVKVNDKRIKQVFDYDNLPKNIDTSLKSPSMSEIVIDYILSDPEKIFIKEHIQGYPEANFHTIFRYRSEGLLWKEISLKLANINSSTLMSFYSRCFKKFASNIQKNLINDQ